jgi:hypothetical protein
MAKKPSNTEEQVEAPVAATADSKKETVVKMTDGRSVTFVGKKRLLKDSFVDEAGKVSVRLDFVNGETRTFVCPDSLIAKAAGHGLEQKLGDQIAGEDDVDDAVLAIDKLISKLEIGEWNSPREAGGMSGTSVLLQALVRLSGKSKEDMMAFLKDKTNDQKAALRNDPKIRPVIKTIEDEKAAAALAKSGAKVDTGGLLGEIGL